MRFVRQEGGWRVEGGSLSSGPAADSKKVDSARAERADTVLAAACAVLRAAIPRTPVETRAFLPRGAVAVLAAFSLAAGCARTDAGPAGHDSGTSATSPKGAAGPGAVGAAPPGSGPRRSGPPRPATPGQAPPSALRAAGPYAGRLEQYKGAQLVAAARRWGLARPPIAPPPPPARKPRLHTRDGFEVDGSGEGLPPVVTTVPTRDKVVFLTIDDGEVKDPEFLRMAAELGIPFSAFLTGRAIEDDYGYFRRMRDQGVTLNSHTMTHPFLPKLSRGAQHREICGMQEVMENEFGTRPGLFRPPFGNYDRDTLLVARSCGVRAVPLWNEEIFPGRIVHRERDKNLRRGDILLTHFQGEKEWKGRTMRDMLRTLLDRITAEGYAVARLEDYL